MIHMMSWYVSCYKAGNRLLRWRGWMCLIQPPSPPLHLYSGCIEWFVSSLVMPLWSRMQERGLWDHEHGGSKANVNKQTAWVNLILKRTKNTQTVITLLSKVSRTQTHSELQQQLHIQKIFLKKTQTAPPAAYDRWEIRCFSTVGVRLGKSSRWEIKTDREVTHPEAISSPLCLQLARDDHRVGERCPSALCLTLTLCTQISSRPASHSCRQIENNPLCVS